MKTVALITGNENKAREIKEILQIEIEAIDLDIPEIQSLNVEEVAREKALSAYQKLKRPLIVDDTSLSIDAWNGLPGTLITWFLGSVGSHGIEKMLESEKNRKASVSTCIGYADENGAKTFLGTIHGSIATKERGENGFGYDTIFIPKNSEKTYAQMTFEEKNQNSMRTIALKKCKEFLIKNKDL
ncbi:MAG: RdgB/HAM1 family non-canonical purine NTP pyrophosphatase [Candidatus Moranbacteria bacterium]|nr:RdgB/HAM1 family non-canonical purine NTP pyrophosphatase [Candidatus Moranbacteria bacterium]